MIAVEYVHEFVGENEREAVVPEEDISHPPSGEAPAEDGDLQSIAANSLGHSPPAHAYSSLAVDTLPEVSRAVVGRVSIALCWWRRR